VKKILSFLVMTFALMLPIFVNATTEIKPNCGAADADGYRSCTVSYNITDANGLDNLTVTLTEQGGAQVTAVENTVGSDWTISSQNEENNVWTVLLTSPGVAGEGNLFTFKYLESGTADCKVIISLGDKKVEVVPEDTPEDVPGKDQDTPTENEQTGISLPYIALGAIVLVAGGAYIVTRNKSKMYKI